MRKLKSAITWFDIPVTEMERAVKFYENIFHIQFQQLSFDNGLKMALFPVEEGTVSGALTFHPEHYIPAKVGALVYLNGEPDLQLVLDKIEQNGGQILLPKSLISEHWGFMALFKDTEGNRVALHSAK